MPPRLAAWAAAIAAASSVPVEPSSGIRGAPVEEAAVEGADTGEFERLASGLRSLQADGEASDLLRRLEEEHQTAVHTLREAVHTLMARRDWGAEFAAEARGTASALTAPQNIAAQSEARGFFAPVAASVGAAARLLWDPSLWGDTSVSGPGSLPTLTQPPWVTKLFPAGAAQFGYNICRNSHLPNGGCCQQIVHCCCTAAARNDPTRKWQMCFNPATQMMRVILPNPNYLIAQEERDQSYEILMSQCCSSPTPRYHARWRGPNRGCFLCEDITVYQLNR